MTALLALLLLGVVRAGEEVAVEVVTYRRAPRGLLVGLLKGPFAWVKASEEGGVTSLSLAPPRRRRGSRQQFLGDSDKPLLKFNERSAETALIAERISALFESGQAVAVPSVPTISPVINYVNMTVTGLTSQLNRPASSGSSPFQLGINLNLELEHGKPNTVRVPQGELMLMYLPQIRNPNGGAAVELSHSHLQKILAETSHPSSMVMLPTGGLLLMSLAPYTDTDTGYRVKEHTATDSPGFQGPLIQDLNTVSRQQQQQMQVVKQTQKPDISKRVTATTTTAPLLAGTGFKYPAAWKNKIPKFPYVPPPKEEDKEVPVEEEDTGPVFPHRPRLPSPPPLRLNLTWPHTTSPTTPRTTATTIITTTTRAWPVMLTTRSQLFNNQIDVHRPRLKNKANHGGSQPGSSGTFLVRSPLTTQPVRNLLTKQPVRSLLTRQQEDGVLEKRYRQEERPTSTLGFDNVNVVIPGRFNLSPSPDGVIQCKKDSSTNGTRVCSTQLANNCQGGFKLGGNCNGQQRQDNTRLPPSEFRMGEEQGGGSLDTRFVPFSPQQTNMAMGGPARPSPAPPLQLNYQLDSSIDSFVRLSTRPPTTRPPTTTTAPTTTLSERQQMVNHVMAMEPPELVDALMDPMMMVMGSMMAMAGAYMAIAIDEVAATNALAFASAGLGGKKRRK